MPFLRTLKLYPIVFLFTHGFYTTNHISSDPSCDWYSLGLSYYMSSECSSICACVFFWSGRAFVFPILLMIIYFSYFRCLYISVFSSTSCCLPESPFCSLPFHLWAHSGWLQTFPGSGSHFHALSLSPILRAFQCFITLDVYETELRKESDLRRTGG